MVTLVQLLALPIFTARHTWIRLALALTVLSLLSCAPPVRALAGRVLNFPTSRSVGKLTALGKDPQGLFYDKSQLGDARGAVAVPADALVNIDVNWDGLNDLSFLKKLKACDLQGLELAYSGHGFALDDASVANFAHLKGLKQLSLEQTDIGDSGIQKIGQMSDLELLNLNHTMLTTKGMPYLANLHKLVQLELEGTQLSDASLANIAGHTQLLTLFIKSCGLGPAAAQHLQKMNHLKILRLSENKFGDKGMALLPAYPELVELHVSNCSLTDAGFAQLVKFPRLITVFAKGNKISGAGFKALAQCKKLQYIELTGEPCALADVAELRNSKSVTGVWLMPKPGDEAAIKKAVPKINFRFSSQRGKVPAEFFEPLH